MEFIAHHETEGRAFLSFMNTVVMGEFSKGKVFNPEVRIFAAIDAEVSFKFLVHAFSLTISLRMIGSG